MDGRGRAQGLSGHSSQQTGNNGQGAGRREDMGRQCHTDGEDRIRHGRWDVDVWIGRVSGQCPSSSVWIPGWPRTGGRDVSWMVERWTLTGSESERWAARSR